MEEHLRGTTHTTLLTSLLMPSPTKSSIAEDAAGKIQALLALQTTNFRPTDSEIRVQNESTINGVMIGLLSSFGSAILIALIFFVVYFFRYTSSGRIFLDRIGRPGEYDDEQAYAREEAEALEDMDDLQRTEYFRAKAFIEANPPDSLPTDISLSQYLAIQEKGVSAWEFEPELEIANCFVEGRTEIENGKKLEDVAHGLKSHNLFPAVGANGPCTVHVNFGQSGFVFIEANVKKWGLAPMTGSLAPPPPYGSEQGSILLEAGREGAQSSHGTYPDTRHGRTRSGNFRYGPPTSPGPVRSPTDISLAHLTHISSNDEPGESSAAAALAPESTTTTVSHVGLGVSEPPPEYTSPHQSNTNSPRGSVDSEQAPLFRRKNTPPPIPSYNDTVAEDRARDRAQGQNQSRRDQSGSNRVSGSR
ncbi:SPRY domain-containing protein [Diplocarpon rosae]|nr:SPRY domain-containing protein [Diplocarpon rosae]